MQFGQFATVEAEGAILAHTTRLEDRQLRKGRCLTATDIEALVRAGHANVTAARFDPDDIDENSAASRVARAYAGDGVEFGAAFAGRVNLRATAAGVMLIEASRLTAMNAIDEAITVATLEPFAMQGSPGHAHRIGAIILAAGMSSRMGRNKLLVEIDGEPLLRRVAAAVMASHASPVIVVVGGEAEAARTALAGVPVSIVSNPDFRDGLSTSLRTGVREMPKDCDGALVVLGDMPGVSGAFVDRMIDAFEPDENREICIATSGGKRGNPVLWGRRFFADLLGISGDVGAKHLIAGYEEMVCEVEASDDGPLTDIDTPESLEAWLARRK